jgi:predicted MPP superfamily phosphohydrolase
MNFRILLLALLILIIDLYVFQAFRLGFRSFSGQFQKILFSFYWFLAGVSILIPLLTFFVPWAEWSHGLRTYAGAFVFVLVFSKLFVVIFLMADDLIRLFRWGWTKISPPPAEITDSGAIPISRSDFLVRTGLILAAVPFLSLVYGMVRGAYNLQIRKQTINFKKLPDSFRGFRIVQISDFHVGSFISSEPVEEAIRQINALEPDVVVFTGDLVNNVSSEVEPHLKALSGLNARHGVFSILGNHDYGDYVMWDTPELKKKNLADLIEAQKKIGWDILLDEHRELKVNNESIFLVGVQNYSMHMRFPKYGNLKKATSGMKDSETVTILLSHDPSHWRGEVLGRHPNIDLTLSGHTHGFQFGVEIPGFRWSPVQYVYKEWAGKYTEAHQHLYVNRGIGFLGYPGRVGILPEITVIELNRDENA